MQSSTMGGGAPVHLSLAEPAMVGRSMRDVFSLADRTGHTDLPVLVLGETGAGKEVVARAFHQRSRRAEGAFCEVNCAAIPATIVETILFGHERGAFTGADRRATGLFEQAEGGSLFLDEVGELSESAQAALLRAIECKRIRRVGAATEIAVDVRVIGATNRDLHRLAQSGRFRADLLYRLETLTVNVPPLRNRVDEIEPLALEFLVAAALRWGTKARSFSERAMQHLASYPWPGNIRQLKNVVERAAAICDGTVVCLEHLPAQLFDGMRGPASEPAEKPFASSLPDQVRQFEIVKIREALTLSSGNRSRAAELLRIPRRTLGSKLRLYGLE